MEAELINALDSAIDNLQAAKERQLDNRERGAGAGGQLADERAVQWWEDELARAATAWRDWRRANATAPAASS